MKIAVPVIQGQICDFTVIPCRSLLIFTADEDRIIYEEVLEIKGCDHNILKKMLPELLYKGVECMLVQTIEPLAGEVLSNKGIKVYTGNQGDAKTNAELFVQDKLALNLYENQLVGETGEFVWSGIEA